jgi:hypothetical protein
MKRNIFEQEQIARAVQLGLGASSPADIEIAAVGPQSIECRDAVSRILSGG